MKKSDLKTGMILEKRDGRQHIVMLNTVSGNMTLRLEPDRVDFDEYTEDLKSFHIGVSPHPEWDIVKIYQPIVLAEVFQKDCRKELLWEREPEPIEMTLEEACKKLRDTMGKPVKITI